jgi:hypothetical protein
LRRQFARALVFASQTKLDSSPRATTGDAAQTPARTGVESEICNRIGTISNAAAESLLVIFDAPAPRRPFRCAQTPARSAPIQISGHFGKMRRKPH